MGSVREARRAGMVAASRAARSRRTATAGEEDGVARRFVEPGGEKFGEGEAEGDAGDEAGGDGGGGGAEDEAGDVAGGGAECEADAEFVGAGGDGVGDDAVEADDGEGERESGEDSEQCGDEALIGVFGLDLNFVDEIARRRRVAGRRQLLRFACARLARSRAARREFLRGCA